MDEQQQLNPDEIESLVRTIGAQARVASRVVAQMTGAQRTALLQAMAGGIRAQTESIAAANAMDVDAACASGLDAARIDRLRLDPERIEAMARGVDDVALLADPIGTVLEVIERPSGLRIEKVRVPLGVVGMVYESRPNVTADAAALAFKAGNAVILRGGREALHSNRAILWAMANGAHEAGLPEHAIQLIPVTDRAAARALFRMDDCVDLLIPRGGESLIRAVAEQATIPVLKHYKGVCHVYVDAAADLTMAHDIAMNAKVQRPGVCNAMETLLVHADVAAELLPRLARSMHEAGVELRGDARAQSMSGEISMGSATAEDWSAEYLALVLSVRVVDGLDEAIDHIECYGSHHSDAIVTSDDASASAFLQRVDSAAVYHNASTRFTDGAEFGMGAEIGISTDKLHARGPCGIMSLTTYKYVGHGTGQVRG